MPSLVFEMAFLKIYTLFLLIALVRSQSSEPMVQIKNGIIQGSWKSSTNGRSYASFMGIPYARPPVGKYRFREPHPIEPWCGVLNATQPLSPCLQYDPFLDKIKGSEDCLFVNVDSPKPHRDAKMPVMVFIHGGAFMYGSGAEYGTLHFMDRDMVVVTFNYRLGPIGFLSTGDKEISGNAGLKDQSFALKWVRDNIKMFGGDPHSVTLTGVSAGSSSVHYHYLSPLSKGTFHRGIAFSGTAFSPWALSVKPAEKAKTLAEIGWKVHPFSPFPPSVEAPGSKNAFLTEHPYFATRDSPVQRVPLITSSVSDEGLYPAAMYQTKPDVLTELESEWNNLANEIFVYNDTLPQNIQTTVANRIKERYLHGKPVGQDTFAELVQALGDRLITSNAGKLAQLYAKSSGQPSYFCRYSYRAQYSLSNLIAHNSINYGVSHGDDVLLFFKYLPQDSTRPEDIQMRETFIDMIYSFATTSVPKIRNGSEWLHVEPDQKELSYLEIAGPENIKMKTSKDFGHKCFWDNLGFNENENYRVS